MYRASWNPAGGENYRGIAHFSLFVDNPASKTIRLFAAAERMREARVRSVV
jgi:hypothetical protein